MFSEVAELHAVIVLHIHAVYIRVISDFRRELDEILNLEGRTR